MKWSDFLFGILLLLLLIPQTGKPIQVAINKAKILVWNPTIQDESKIEVVKPFDYSLVNLKDVRVVNRIGDGKPVFLSFWATWCPPCVAELPSIESLYRDYGDHIDFILITNEKTDVVKAFLEKTEMNIPVFFPLAEVPKVLQSSSLPTNYLIDQEGNILIKEIGAANWNSKKVRDLLDTLLEE